VRSSKLGLFAVATAIAFVGALWSGLPLAGLAPALIVLACPLMMVLMMKGMHGGGDSEHSDTDESRDQHLHH
jgi:choline-glycine betaine transporter